MILMLTMSCNSDIATFTGRIVKADGGVVPEVRVGFYLKGQEGVQKAVSSESGVFDFSYEPCCKKLEAFLFLERRGYQSKIEPIVVSDAAVLQIEMEPFPDE